MNTRLYDQVWNELTDDLDTDSLDLSASEEIELLYDADAANEDYWDTLCNNDEEWEAAAAEGFLIF